MFTLTVHPEIMNPYVKIASRYSTGLVTFVSAGYLIFAILSDNGGTIDSQAEWQQAAQTAVPIKSDRGGREIEIAEVESLGIDRTITGSIRNIAEEAPDSSSGETARPNPEQELTVLELIRNNSNISPGVSAGTDRVSVIVEKGDTLFGISRRHGIGIKTLARLNNLEEPYTIKVGQTLYLAR